MELHLFNCNGPNKLYSSFITRNIFGQTIERITIEEDDGTTQVLELLYHSESFLQVLHNLYKCKEMKGITILNY